MRYRHRHCVECPKCLIRYLVGFSPYRNGSYLVRSLSRLMEEYSLYCTCRGSYVRSRCTYSEVKTCKVSEEAYRRGYGTTDEVVIL
jgi:hypothetical protein